MWREEGPLRGMVGGRRLFVESHCSLSHARDFDPGKGSWQRQSMTIPVTTPITAHTATKKANAMVADTLDHLRSATAATAGRGWTRRGSQLLAGPHTDHAWQREHDHPEARILRPNASPWGSSQLSIGRSGPAYDGSMARR